MTGGPFASTRPGVGWGVLFDLLRFNQDLAKRLRPWLPPGVRLVSTIDAVTIENDEHVSVSVFVSDLFDRSPHDVAAVRAAHQVLDAVQHFLSEELGEPWPPIEGHPLPASSLATPAAEEHDGLMQLWYGDAVEPTLALSPMRLAEYRS